jgi:hypothetical protein
MILTPILIAQLTGNGNEVSKIENISYVYRGFLGYDAVWSCR